MTSPDTHGRVPVVLLASGQGSLARAVLSAFTDPTSALVVVALVADRECGALAHARDHGVPTHVVALADHTDRAEWDRVLAEVVTSYSPGWVVSAGFMRILGPAFLDRFAQRVLNTHPALLPSFPGAHAVRDALAYGVTITGCTVHVVDDGVDTGPVVAQRAVEIAPDDTEASLHERIRVHERELLVDVLGAAARGRLQIEGRKVVRT